ncbi:MAG: hypothetical protein K1X46_05525 [Chitinophagaceae bacterium]|nr:hypothetical protein [Chitinophagaceae bacterium]
MKEVNYSSPFFSSGFKTAVITFLPLNKRFAVALICAAVNAFTIFS